MKHAFLAEALVAAGLAGCASTGQLTPAAQTQVTDAFNTVCPGVTSGALDQVAGQFNAKVKSAYAAAQQICANGAPTNLVVAGMDIVTLQTALAPYLSKVHVSTSGVRIK